MKRPAWRIAMVAVLLMLAGAFALESSRVEASVPTPVADLRLESANCPQWRETDPVAGGQIPVDAASCLEAIWYYDAPRAERIAVEGQPDPVHVQGFRVQFKESAETHWTERDFIRNHDCQGPGHLDCSSEASPYFAHTIGWHNNGHLKISTEYTVRVAAQTWRGDISPWAYAAGTPEPGNSEFLSEETKRPGRVRGLKMMHNGDGNITVRWRHPENSSEEGRAPERYMIHLHRLEKHGLAAPIRKSVAADRRRVAFTGMETPGLYAVEVWAVNRAGKGERAFLMQMVY